MGSTGGDAELLLHLFEEALRRAEAEGEAVRAAGRADASRRVAAVETERREILTDTMYRASLMLREAEVRAAALQQEALLQGQALLHNAEAERDRLRDEALIEAKRIREDAAEDAGKLMWTLNTERDHILADARDDARRIIEDAQEAVFVHLGSTAFAPSEDFGDDEELFVAPETIVHVPDDAVWDVDADELSDDPPNESRFRAGVWKRRRRKWYERQR